MSVVLITTSRASSSMLMMRLIISSLCSRAKSPRNVTTPAREFVVDAPAGRAHFFGDTFALRDPSPAPLVVDGAALRADRTLVQLSLMLVRIENVILLRTSCDAARCSWPLRPRVRLFHIGSVRCEIDTVSGPAG